MRRLEQATPHARGSTFRWPPGNKALGGYPACAGIDRSITSARFRAWGLPRMRGDRPHSKRLCKNVRAATPHARGSTLKQRYGYFYCFGYPACAGIDRSITSARFRAWGLPRMRGDRPDDVGPTLDPTMATPHARGST